jgi:sterol desaturase/sphingolipid hydroxylase (fatty acid hydroxylase superfamily)
MDKLAHRFIDFFMGHGSMIVATGTFTAVAVVSFIVQLIIFRKQISLKDFINHCFPFDGWKSKSVQIDIIVFLGGKLLRGFESLGDSIITAVLAAGIGAGLHWLFPHYVAHEAGIVTIIIWSIVLYVASDFGLYWTHYLEHKVDFLWEVHKLHHSAEFLNPMTALRTHPLSLRFEHAGTTATVAIPLGIMVFLYKLDIGSALLMLANTGLIMSALVMEVLHHSQFPISYGWLDRIFISPRMHQMHHSAKYEHWDHNIGVQLTIWDWMFGTAVLPTKGEVLTYGIGRGSEYNDRYYSLYGAYVLPIVDSIRVLLGKPVAELPVPESLAAQGLTEPPKKTKKKAGVAAAEPLQPAE